MNDGKGWAVYTRVSTEDQAREGVSLELQRVACVEQLRVLGHRCEAEIEDAGQSAKNLDRPGAARLLALIEEGAIAGVIVYKLDRLTRSVADLCNLLTRLEAAGVALISVRETINTGTATGRFFIGLIGLIAQWEREQISERVQAGMDHRRKAGGFLGGRPPAGCRVEGPPGGRQLVRDDAIGEIVAPVWAMILAGKSTRDVAEYLTAKGVPAKSRAWTAAGAHKLLTNNRAVGLLVDAETFSRVAAAMAGRSSPTRKRASATPVQITQSQTHADRIWPLSGIAICGGCGSRLIGVTARSATGGRYPYLRCTGRVRKGPSYCKWKDLAAEPWEAAVVEALVLTVQRDDDLLAAVTAYEAELVAAAGPLREQREAAVLERDRLSVRVANLVELAAQGGAVARGIGPALAQAQEAVERAERALGMVEGQLGAVEQSEAGAAALVAAIRSDLSTLATDPPEQQAATLRSTVESARLFPPAKPGGKARIELRIKLPRLIQKTNSGAGAPEFVRPRPMVEHRTLRTNSAVPITVNRELSTVRELRARWSDAEHPLPF